jgi:hypothetical protein
MLDVPSPANDMPWPDADCSRIAMPPAFAVDAPAIGAASTALASSKPCNFRLFIAFPPGAKPHESLAVIVGEIVPVFAGAAIDCPLKGQLA